MIPPMQTASVGAPLRAASTCGGLALLACLAVIYATPNDAFWVVDSGSKALLAQRLLETRYTELNFDYPAAHLDPTGRAFPIPPPYAVPRGDGFVSQYPPAYPAVAVPFLAVLGAPGLRVPAALGVAACVFLFVLWTAPALGRTWATAGGAALAGATPLFFYGVTVWEHSLTVALSLGSWTVLSRRTRERLWIAGLLLGLSCWLRAELALMAVAVGISCYAHDRKLRDVWALAVGAAPALAALAVFNAIAFGDPRGVHVLGNVGAAVAAVAAGDLIARASAILSGFGGSSAEGVLFGVSIAGCLLGGALAAARNRGTRLAIVAASAVGIAASLYGSVQTATASVPWIALAYYNGFLIRMPGTGLAGIGAVRVWQRPEYAALRVGAGAGLLFLTLGIASRVSLTDFMSGGHWGPRMLLPAVPALVAFALVAIHAETARAARRTPRFLIACALALVAVSLASTAVSIRLLDAQKREARGLQEAVVAATPPVIVTNYSPMAQQLAGIWGRVPMLLAASEPAFSRIIAELRRAGIGSFLFVERPSGEPVQPERGVSCRLTRRYRGKLAPYVFDVDLRTCAIAAGPRR
jgi:hypothetical protein